MDYVELVNDQVFWIPKAQNLDPNCEAIEVSNRYQYNSVYGEFGPLSI